MRFKVFFAEKSAKQSDDVKETLDKLPVKHRQLVNKYKFHFEKNNTLEGDDGHIGLNNLKHKQIFIAAPWRYGREFTLLHEIGHSVWKEYMEDNQKLKDEWHRICKNTKGKLKQDEEELFCHAYANYYSKNKIVVHTHDAWEKFIKSLPK